MPSEHGKQVKLLIWNDTTKTWEKFDGKITAGDIEIGVVELKDATATTRANVKAANTVRTTSTIVLATQPIDASGAVLSTSALATSAKQLADDHNVTVSNPTADPETGLATSANQLADGHNVAIVSATGINGGDVSVGTTEVEMTFTGTTKAVMIQSKVANTGYIWVGLTGVTNSGGSALAQLSPGQSVSIDLNDASAALYSISDTAAQTVYRVALT